MHPHRLTRPARFYIGFLSMTRNTFLHLKIVNYYKSNMLEALTGVKKKMNSNSFFWLKPASAATL